MSHQPTLCIDLDGTLVAYDHWRGPDHFGAVLPGARAALQQFKAQGWRIIIFTTRGNIDAVQACLQQHQIPFDYINHNPDQPDSANEGKPIADIYIDDRAIPFRGDWDETANAVANFRVWYHGDYDDISPY